MMLVQLAGLGSAPALFEQSMIGLIENIIIFTLDTRKHGLSRENN
jgi:hypothetical protein